MRQSIAYARCRHEPSVYACPSEQAQKDHGRRVAFSPWPDPADHTLPVRFTAEQVRKLDRLRRAGETRSAAIRRIFDRVTYAHEVALAAVRQGSPPRAHDPRVVVAHGEVSIVFDIPPGGVGLGVIDTASGVALHKMKGAEETEAGYMADPVPARASALRRLEGLIRTEAADLVRSLAREDADRISEADWVEWAMAAARDFERIR